MSKTPTREERARELSKLAAFYRRHPLESLANEAMELTSKRGVPDFLIDLSRDPLPPAERVFLTSLLYHIAIGDDVRIGLGITPRRLGHRERDPMTRWIVAEVKQRIEEGDEQPAAYRDVGKLVGKDAGSVRKLYERSGQ